MSHRLPQASLPDVSGTFLKVGPLWIQYRGDTGTGPRRAASPVSFARDLGGETLDHRHRDELQQSKKTSETGVLGGEEDILGDVLAWLESVREQTGTSTTMNERAQRP